MEYKLENFTESRLTEMTKDPSRLPVMKIGKDPAVDFADDGREIPAHFLGFRRCEDNSYILYAYRYKDAEYGFLWETYFDEKERAAGGGEPHIWYDDIREGQSFLVRIRLKDPKQHVILDEPFTGINDSTVIYLSDGAQFRTDGDQ